MATAGWWKQFLWIFVLFALAVSLGWVIGEISALVALAALLTLGYWSVQLWRASLWIRHPDREPPAAHGLWGEFFDSIYRLQRHDREVRDRLQTAVSYLRNSFAALKDATVLIDPAGNIEWSNGAAQELLGLEYPRDRGQAVVKLMSIPGFKRYFDEGDYSEPLYIRGPSDAELRLMVEVTPFGQGSRLLFARDVTREIRLEKMRRDFVANVSHELRTPLTVITGYLHTLLESGVSGEPRLQRPLEQMKQQAERMETLLRDLLWLFQIEATDGREEFATVDMADLLAEVRQSVQGAYPDRGLTAEVKSGRLLEGNYKQLYSAVSNLVINALKYSDGDVDIRWMDRDGDSCLCVTDRGPGIDSGHLPRLTERFYRVDKSRSQDTGGTGLGLAIVKHVLAGHGAQLEIDSELGVGSTFRCVFPMSR